jgi:hypothetical protein
MGDYQKNRLPACTLQHLHLPNIRYSIPKSDVERLIAGSMDLPFTKTLVALQVKKPTVEERLETVRTPY